MSRSHNALQIWTQRKVCCIDNFALCGMYVYLHRLFWYHLIRANAHIGIVLIATHHMRNELNLAR